MKKSVAGSRFGRATLAALLLCLGAGVVRAQGPERTVTMQEAVEIAVEQNRNVEAARVDISKADRQVDEALGNALPTVDFNARYTRNLQSPVFFFPGEDGIVQPIKVGSDNALSADISLQQIVFNSAVFTGVGTAEVYAKISRQGLRAAASEVVWGTRQVYLGTLLSREVLLVNEATLINAEQNFENVRKLYEAGLRAEFDKIRADVAVANLKPTIVAGRNVYENALDRLAVALGFEPEQTELRVTGSFLDPAAAPPVGSYAELEATMLANNPQLELLRLTADVNREIVEINRSDYLPTVALFGTYKYEAQADNFGDLDFQPTAFLGLNLSLNLYNGGRTDAKVEQSRLDFDRTRFELAELEANLKSRLEAALRRLGAATEQVAASDRTIEQAERAYDIATAAYRAGTATQLDVNDADLALAQSRLNRLNALHEYNVARAEIDYLVGADVRLVGDDVVIAE